MAHAQSRDAFEVLDWIMSRHVHELCDAAGRPIGEGRAAAFQQVQTEMRTCPYAGSRYHHAKLMNVSALQQMPDWQHVLTMLSWLGQRFRAARHTEITTGDDLAQVTSAGVFLVDFLVLRHHQPIRSHEIPVLISGLYKACLGLQLAYLPERFTDPPTSTQLPDAVGFYDYLEANGLLIGESEVCSGSPAMIMQAYDAILSRDRISPEDLPPPCDSLRIDWEQFDIFTYDAATIWRDLVLYVTRILQFRPRVHDPRLPTEVEDRLNALLEQRAAELLEGQRGLVVDLARIAQEYGGNVDSSTLPESPAAEAPSPVPPPGSLAAIVLDWLGRVAEAEVRTYEPVMAATLQSRFAPFDTYEAAVLDALNQHLSRLMNALGRVGKTDAVTPSDLSHVCGRTLRDWGATSW